MVVPSAERSTRAAARGSCDGVVAGRFLASDKAPPGQEPSLALGADTFAANRTETERSEFG